MARVGSTSFKTTKMAGYAKEIDVVDESDEEIQRVSQEKDAQNTKKSTNLLFKPSESSEICKQPKKAWKILIKDWQAFIFCMNILVFRYNIYSVMIFPSG